MNNELKFLENYKVSAILILVVVILAYLFSITGLDLSIKTTSDMGAIGDFFGGLLNPIFALIGLFALLATIDIQSKALKISSEELVNSRNELELTRKEVEKATKAQEEQSYSIKLQNFENTFFKMIDVYNSIISNLTLNKIKNIGNCDDVFYLLGHYIGLKTNEDVKEKETIKQLVYILRVYRHITREEEYKKKYKKEYKEVYDNFHDYFEDKISHYFGFIYQILKFLKDAEDNNIIENPKKYAHLFRSLFSKSELALLSFHCLGTIGSEKFKPLVEHFEFFEHLPINILADDLIIRYDRNVFGKNNKYKNKFDKINSNNK